jgi:hypothetical protein
MALRIEDVSSLPGRKVVDQEGKDVGEIKEVYGIGDDDDPMWVAICTSPGGMAADNKIAFVPLARLREADECLSVPYSVGHIERAPEIEVEDEISEEDDNKLRVYYAVGLADEEFRNEPQSYASQVPEGEAPARKVTDDLDSGSSDGDSEGSSDGDSEESSDGDSEESSDGDAGKSESDSS